MPSSKIKSNSSKPVGTRKSGKPTGSSSSAKSSSSSSSSVTYAPTNFSRTNVTRPAQMSGSPFAKDGSITVSHREFITDLYSNGGIFSSLLQGPITQDYLTINPGNSITFPWLSQMATLFESYTFIKLKFLFESNASTATPGSIMMAADYDWADVSPPDKSSLMSYHNAVRSSAWSESCFTADRADLDRLGKTHYVSAIDSPPNQDPKLLHTGAFYAYASAVTPGVVGELYVEYTVQLRTPQFNRGTLFNNFVVGHTFRSDAAGTILPTARFGSTPVIVGDTGLITLSPTSNIVTFNEVGQFLLELYTTGTTVIGDAVAAVGSGLLAVLQSTTIDAGLTAMTSIFRVKVITPGPTAVFTMNPGATTLVGGTMRVCPYNYALG